MIRPINDTIIVRADPKVALSSIIETPKEDTRTGVVVAAGGGKKLPTGKIRPMLVSVGDHILFSGTIDQEIDGLLVMKDQDVIGLI
jgi:co-chaperonin GroES (HSP10)